MLDFSCDYNVGAAPEIMEALNRINDDINKTYGFDQYCESAKEKIRKAVGNEHADVWFLVGGTQTNEIGLTALLNSYEGVICAETAHIAVHEAGAIEASGHKVITVDAEADGRINIDSLKDYLATFHADPTLDHMVYPSVLYITHPTEYGGVYSLDELKQLRIICDQYGMKMYLDGARLAYGLAAEGADVTLKDLGELLDAFYIGGTKCGTLMGEALVFKKEQKKFFTHRKQHGGLLAKGWLLGLQFDVMFTENNYFKLGQNAINQAMAIKNKLLQMGIEFYSDSKSNQQFVLLSDELLDKVNKSVKVDFWGKQGAKNIVRICTNWKTTDADTAELIKAFQ